MCESPQRSKEAHLYLHTLHSQTRRKVNIISSSGSLRSEEKMGGVEMVLPKEYGYVAIVLVFYCFLNLWMGAQVGKARKQYVLLLCPLKCFGFVVFCLITPCCSSSRQFLLFCYGENFYFLLQLSTGSKCHIRPSTLQNLKTKMPSSSTVFRFD